MAFKGCFTHEGLAKVNILRYFLSRMGIKGAEKLILNGSNVNGDIQQVDTVMDVIWRAA